MEPAPGPCSQIASPCLESHPLGEPGTADTKTVLRATRERWDSKTHMCNHFLVDDGSTAGGDAEHGRNGINSTTLERRLKPTRPSRQWAPTTTVHSGALRGRAPPHRHGDLDRCLRRPGQQRSALMPPAHVANPRRYSVPQHHDDPLRAINERPRGHCITRWGCSSSSGSCWGAGLAGDIGRWVTCLSGMRVAGRAPALAVARRSSDRPRRPSRARSCSSVVGSREEVSA
jgi:hypothetical protein